MRKEQELCIFGCNIPHGVGVNYPPVTIQDDGIVLRKSI